jgi:enolase-like protein
LNAKIPSCTEGPAIGRIFFGAGLCQTHQRGIYGRLNWSQSTDSSVAIIGHTRISCSPSQALAAFLTEENRPWLHFKACEAAGWDRDVMGHCSWNYDLRTSIQIADAVAPIKPVWLEDPMAVPYTESWKRLTEVSKTPICMGENLVFREQFMDFIMNVGADIIHPDLRNTGGFLPTSRVAQLASLYGLPMATHNTGSQVNTYAAA